MRILITVFMIHMVHLDLSTCQNCKTTVVEVPDYYWREYRGIIPNDAVPGGSDTTGATTYISQALISPQGILVGTIYQGNKTVAGTADGKTFYTEKNIKILCSRSPQKFKWIKTNTEQVHLLTDCDLVSGGYDRGMPLSIGRVNYRNEVIVGKVVTTTVKWDGLWVPDNGPEKQFKNYEVLGYGCQPVFDVRALMAE